MEHPTGDPYGRPVSPQPGDEPQGDAGASEPEVAAIEPAEDIGAAQGPADEAPAVYEPRPYGTAFDEDAPSPDPEPAPEPERPPLLLGRYEILEQRGSGAFSTVFVCRDTRLRRRVAIKRLPLTQDPTASTSTLDEVAAEAQTLAQLTHPNIVTIHDYDISGNAAYLIMEYVEGLTLAELLQRAEGGELVFDECAYVLSSIASGLHAAHDAGVFHLDIKPSNVFIDPKGTVKLGDFGMAAAAGAGYAGARGGTIGYMPPEQADSLIVDATADIFSLAVTCYQALTGTNPFAARKLEDSIALIEAGARPLSEVDEEIPTEASELIAQAMSASPGERPKDVQEFADEVCPLLGDVEAGKASLVDLIANVTSEDEGGAEDDEEPPLLERYPWLPDAFVRGLSALGALGCGLACLPAFEAAGAGALGPLGAIGVAAACGAWPRVTGPLAFATVALGALARGLYSPAFLVAVLVLLGGAAWWRRLGEGPDTDGHPRLAGAAIALPCLAFAPVGPALAGWALAPAPAALTAAASWLLQGVARLVCTGAGSGEAAGQALAQGCLALATSPTTWLGAGLCALAAAACSWLCRRGDIRLAYAGQALCMVMLVGMQFLVLRVENGGIWETPPAAGLALAVVFSLLMIFATYVLDVVRSPREDG